MINETQFLSRGCGPTNRTQKKYGLGSSTSKLRGWDTDPDFWIPTKNIKGFRNLVPYCCPAAPFETDNIDGCSILCAHGSSCCHRRLIALQHWGCVHSIFFGSVHFSLLK